MLQTSENLSILDMSGASQANVSFVTSFGHRITSEDIVGTMQHCFGDEFFTNQQAASNAHRFLEQILTFPDASFDGALVWDILQFLTPPLLNDVVTKLLRVLRPGAMLLVFFNADEKTDHISVCSYRIQDAKHLTQVPRSSTKQRCEYFNHRTLERIFEDAASLKFFLTRGHLRELLVRR